METESRAATVNCTPGSYEGGGRPAEPVTQLPTVVSPRREAQ